MGCVGLAPYSEFIGNAGSLSCIGRVSARDMTEILDICWTNSKFPTPWPRAEGDRC